MSFLEDRDLARLGREARGWFLHDLEMARRGREARAWLTQDERGRVIGLVLFSVAISIAMSLLATAIVGLVSRRRAGASPQPSAPEVAGEPLAAVESPAVESPAVETRAGVPVMDAAASQSVEATVEA